MGDVTGFTAIFFELSLVLFAAAIFGFILKIFKQPVILAYILAGAMVGFIGLSRDLSVAAFEFFGRIGIALLLFMAGIELSFASLKRVGKTVVLTSLGQMLFTFVFAYLLAKALNFNNLTALYLGFAMTFSSTILVVKLLSEKKNLTSLSGRITVGVLLSQDLVAILLLMFLTGFSSAGQEFLPSFLFLTIVKGIGFVVFVALLSKFFLPKIFHYISDSSELLFLTAISWAFAIASIAKAVGFSFEIGAFLAGLAIANSMFRFQISAKIKPVLDFFIVIFFIALGLKITAVWNISQILVWSLIFSAFVLLVKPLLIMLLMSKFFGHKRRTSFLTAVSLSQISEFSLVLVVLGGAIGQLSGTLSDQVVALVSLTALITIAVSSFLISHDGWLFRKLSPILGIFEPKHPKEIENILEKELSDHVVLVGCDRMGKDVLDFLRNRDDQSFVLVDFNPEIVDTLVAENLDVLFGDVSDPEILEKLNLPAAKLVISTVPDVEDNLILITTSKEANSNLPVFVTTSQMLDGVRLYNAGADYVTVPRLDAGKHLARILSDHWGKLSDISKLKERHLAELWERRHIT